MKTDISWKLPEQAEYIINTLMEHGYDAYVVGGCVRDMLIGRMPGDWDITTSACPQEVKALFPRTIDTGIQHGTVTVMIKKCGYEVTTYRIDGEYEDSRHPKSVQFTAELKEDLRRRDFTINAMAYNHKAGLVDLFGGRKDLEAGVIRCVGDPQERFTEDALRILRAIRFAGQLGFLVETDTLAAMKRLAKNLANISAERVRTEFIKTVVSAHPDILFTAYEQGITAVFLPEFDTMMETGQNHPHHCFHVGEHSVRVLCEMQHVYPGDKEGKDYQCLCLAALFHDIAKPVVKTTDQQGVDHFYGHPEEGERIVYAILKRFKCDNETIAKVRRLVRWHDYRYNGEKKQMRRAISQIGSDLMEDLFVLQACDVLAQSADKAPQKLDMLKRAKELYKQIQKEGECTSLKDLAVNGRDLLADGHKAGRHIGEVLGQLLEHVLEVPQDNKKEILLQMAQEFKI